jgi:hypothetical protein
MGGGPIPVSTLAFSPQSGCLPSFCEAGQESHGRMERVVDWLAKVFLPANPQSGFDTLIIVAFSEGASFGFV